MPILCLVVAVATTDLAADTPAGTDLVVRVEVSDVREELAEAWDQLRPLAGLASGAADATQGAERRFRSFISDLERLTGADLSREGVNVTLSVDLDATGGRVVSAVIRGALPAKIDEKGEELRLGSRSFTLEGRRAYRGSGMAWSFLEQPKGGAVLLIGNERGLRRQLRVADGKGKARASATADPIVGMIGRLRGTAPLLAAFVLPEPVEIDGLSDFRHFLKRVRAGTLRAGAGRVDASLVSEDAADQKAVAHGVRSLAAAVRGVVSLLQGGAELLVGLDGIDEKSDLLPPEIRADRIAPLLDGWANDFRLAAVARERSGNVTEVEIEVSSFRGVLAAAMLGLADAWKAVGGGAAEELEPEVVTLLIGLRAAQLLHKEIRGRYVACGPTPARVPTQPIRWPEETCFAQLAFAPSRPVSIQIEAIEKDGQLLLIARADPDGDGIPHVWYLGEESTQIRGLQGRR